MKINEYDYLKKKYDKINRDFESLNKAYKDLVENRNDLIIKYKNIKKENLVLKNDKKK